MASYKIQHTLPSSHESINYQTSLNLHSFFRIHNITPICLNFHFSWFDACLSQENIVFVQCCTPRDINLGQEILQVPQLSYKFNTLFLQIIQEYNYGSTQTKKYQISLFSPITMTILNSSTSQHHSLTTTITRANRNHGYHN